MNTCLSDNKLSRIFVEPLRYSLLKRQIVYQAQQNEVTKRQLIFQISKFG